MSRQHCSREEELLEALALGTWPESSAELSSHAATCEACGELSIAAAALSRDRRLVETIAPVPTASAMWWRMRLRRQREETARAERTVYATQNVALAVIVLVGVMALAAKSLLPQHIAWVSMPHEMVAGFSAAIWSSIAIVALAAVAWFVIAPVALYLAFSKD